MIWLKSRGGRSCSSAVRLVVLHSDFDGLTPEVDGVPLESKSLCKGTNIDDRFHGIDVLYYYSPQGCLRVKAETISRAGQTDVALPHCRGAVRQRPSQGPAQYLAGGRAACAPSQFDLGAKCSAGGIDLGMRIPREYGSQSP